MLDFKTAIYFCSECRKIVKSLNELLFISEHSQLGFCSENCIEDFYLPIIKHYERTEHSLRKKHNVADEYIQPAIRVEDIIDDVLAFPDEIFSLSNELGDSYFHFIKFFSTYYAIVIASLHENKASFVFLSTLTNSKEFLNEFRHGEKIVLEKKRNEDEDEDMIFIQYLEGKKSKILADVISNKSDTDISFEDYPEYEFCFQETLDQPDEIFEKKDNEGDLLFTYIRSFSKKDLPHEAFFYIVLCLRRDDKKEKSENDVNVYPILAFPTFDIKLCQEYRVGARLTGPLKN